MSKKGKEEKGRSVTSQQVKDDAYRCDLLVKTEKGGKGDMKDKRQAELDKFMMIWRRVQQRRTK